MLSSLVTLCSYRNRLLHCLHAKKNQSDIEAGKEASMCGNGHLSHQTGAKDIGSSTAVEEEEEAQQPLTSSASSNHPSTIGYSPMYVLGCCTFKQSNTTAMLQCGNAKSRNYQWPHHQRRHKYWPVDIDSQYDPLESAFYQSIDNYQSVWICGHG